MRKKGFTLVELLVVIAIIAMLLAILMPALNKVRQIAYRMVCGANLSGLGKACLTYATDYQESYPVVTGATTLKCGATNTPEYWDKNITTDTSWKWSSVTQATVTSSLYLLIKYADVASGQFVCKATDAKKFELSTDTAKQNGTTNIKDVAEGWDFGKSTVGTTGSWDYCSYGYQMPYPQPAGRTTLALTASAQSGLAVMADRGPWFKQGQKNVAVKGAYTAGMTDPFLPLEKKDWGLDTGTTPNKEKIRLANSTNHQQDGQNVLYADSHVSFENQSNVGVTQDNIYTTWRSVTSSTAADMTEVQAGTIPADYATAGGYGETDNLLMN